MILWLVLCCATICLPAISVLGTERCLSGYMTDVQAWVTRDGKLAEEGGSQIVDLSNRPQAVQELRTILMTNRVLSVDDSVQQLSLASCDLTAVPQIFGYRNRAGHTLASTLRYLTFYNNSFLVSSEPSERYATNLNATDAVEKEYWERRTDSESNERWATAFQLSELRNLRELDLRSCSIRTIEAYTFKRMPSLEALYLGENHIMHIEADAFSGLKNVVHLDLSDNVIIRSIGSSSYIQIDSAEIFRPLEQLGSLDLSNTKLSQANVAIFRSFGKSLQKLSMCNVDISSVDNFTFNVTSMKYLDISGNTQLMTIDHQRFMEQLSNKLVVLYADNVGLQSLEIFNNFNKLEILKISNNAINSVPVHVAASWKSLKILEMKSNRLPSWFGPMYSYIPELMFLSLIRNNLNMISDAMILDLSRVKYVGLSDNYFVCSCQTRRFLDFALQAEMHNDSEAMNTLTKKVQDMKILNIDQHSALNFHTGYNDFEQVINNRDSLKVLCQDQYGCSEQYLAEANTSFLLFDYGRNAYTCYTVNDDVEKKFIDVQRCEMDRNIVYDVVMDEQISMIIVMVCVPLFVFAVIGVVLFRRWWCIKYFCITVKNSTMLSLIGNDEKIAGSDPIYHYDVFVSYCNEDRPWVLDQLLPHVEADCNVSVCLHERDFQVGLSILENIVSCMDRSRSIMLIISNKFLLSQWCQFEMHLAQHRLLETRREDLILILLEDVPRRKRPHTLHYLMMTKTYIVWPGSDGGRDHFWRRVKRSLTQNRNALREVSAA